MTAQSGLQEISPSQEPPTNLSSLSSRTFALTQGSQHAWPSPFLQTCTPVATAPSSSSRIQAHPNLRHFTPHLSEHHLDLDHPRLRKRKHQTLLMGISSSAAVAAFLAPCLPWILHNSASTLIRFPRRSQSNFLAAQQQEVLSLTVCPSSVSAGLHLLTGILLMFTYFLLRNHTCWRPARTVASVAFLLHLFSISSACVVVGLLGFGTPGFGWMASFLGLVAETVLVWMIRRAEPEDLDTKLEYYDQCII